MALTNRQPSSSVHKCVSLTGVIIICLNYLSLEWFHVKVCIYDFIFWRTEEEAEQKEEEGKEEEEEEEEAGASDDLVSQCPS